MNGLRWDREAERRLKKVPFFARSLVRKKVEERVLARGGREVSLQDFQEAEERWRRVVDGRRGQELEKMMPAENKPGVEMLVIESCHNELSNCPNVLIKTSDYVKAIEDWAREKDISERLRARVGDSRILYHHKFRISVSGCPNACSRPQIADFGVIGFARPDFNPENCLSCGACAEACPDEAIVMDRLPLFNLEACLGCKKCSRACAQECITLSEPRARILVGGKLGRRPRLAEQVSEVEGPGQAVAVLEKLVEAFLAHGQQGERFADYWAERGREDFFNKGGTRK